jgi:hypothetical protein
MKFTTTTAAALLVVVCLMVASCSTASSSSMDAAEHSSQLYERDLMQEEEASHTFLRELGKEHDIVDMLDFIEDEDDSSDEDEDQTRKKRRTKTKMTRERIDSSEMRMATQIARTQIVARTQKATKKTMRKKTTRMRVKMREGTISDEQTQLALSPS